MKLLDGIEPIAVMVGNEVIFDFFKRAKIAVDDFQIGILKDDTHVLIFKMPVIHVFGKRNDKFALEHCKELFEKHPEVTDVILNYFEMCESYFDVEGSIIEFLNSEEAVYTYQVYQIIEWISPL